MNIKKLTPQKLGNICSLTKYRRQEKTYQDIIDDDLAYISWCMENGYLLLDNAAFTYYEEKFLDA